MASQTQRDIGELFGSLGILTKLSYALMGVLVAIVGGGIALYRDVSEVRTDVALLRDRTTEISERLKRIETQISTVRSTQLDTLTALGKIEGKLPAAPTTPERSPSFLTFNEAESTLLKQFLKPQIAVWKGFATAGYKLGEEIKDGDIQTLPAELIEKFPKLKGFRFAIDQKDNILFFTPTSNRLVGMVPAS